MITVLDALCEGGSAARANDDAYGVSRRAAFVLDGATGLGETLLPGPSDAQWVAVEGAEILAGLADSALTTEALVATTLQTLAARFAIKRIRPPTQTFEIPFASMILLRREAGATVAASFGDCRVLAATADGGFASFGPGRQHRARERARAKAFGTAGAGALRGEALPMLRRLRNMVNSPGYGLLGPELRAAPLLNRSLLALAPPFTALLMSDGFYALVTEYARYSDEGLMRTAAREGLQSLYRELRLIEAGDPELRLYPRFKASDDATALLVAVGPEV